MWCSRLLCPELKKHDAKNTEIFHCILFCGKISRSHAHLQQIISKTWWRWLFISVLHFSQFDPCFQGSILLLQLEWAKWRRIGWVGANSDQVPAISFRVYQDAEKHIEWRSFRSEGVSLVKDSLGRNSNQINLMACRLNTYEKSKNWHATWSTDATMLTALKVMIIWYC